MYILFIVVGFLRLFVSLIFTYYFLCSRQQQSIYAVANTRKKGREKRREIKREKDYSHNEHKRNLATMRLFVSQLSHFLSYKYPVKLEYPPKNLHFGIKTNKNEVCMFSHRRILSGWELAQYTTRIGKQYVLGKYRGWVSIKYWPEE